MINFMRHAHTAQYLQQELNLYEENAAGSINIFLIYPIYPHLCVVQAFVLENWRKMAKREISARC